MKEKNIAIFGDSVFKGVVLNDGRYEISRTINWEHIEKELNVKINNKSKMGATITYGYNKLKEYLEEHAKDTHAIILEYGGNDCDYDWEHIGKVRSRDHKPKTDSQDFVNTLNSMIDLIVSYGVKPILVTLPPISASRYFSWIVKNGNNPDNILYFLGDIETIYRHQEFYSAIIVKVAMERHIELIDIRSEFLNTGDYLNLICEDGIHPSNVGGDIIINTIVNKYKSI